jgi:signal transduction histidine kinase
MRRIAALVLVLIVAGFFSIMVMNHTVVSDVPQAVDGELDAREWNFSRDGMVRLQGEWQMVWGKLIEPKDLQGSIPTSYGWQTVKVPNIWSRYEQDGIALSNQGYATYRLRIKLSEEDANFVKSLYISSVATAYKLWVDGKLIASNGKVGQSKEDMVPQNYAKIAIFKPHGQEVELVIQVSNFVQRKGGLWTPIELGNYEKIIYQRDYRVMATTAVTVCLFSIGLYHCALYVLRKKDTYMLYFGAFCMIISLRTLFLGETLADRMIPWLPWELGVKIEYIAVAIGLPLFTAYVHALYPDELAKRYRNLFAIAGGGYSLLILFTPASFYTNTIQALEIFIVASFVCILSAYGLAIHRKRNGAWLYLLTWLISGIAGLNDIFYYNQWAPNGEWFPIGLLISIFTLAILHSARNSHSFMQVEQLSLELTKLNDSLEAKIKARTIALQNSNSELQKANMDLAIMEQSRRRLLSSISHELKTPLTSIKGYIQAMIEGVIRTDDLKYVKIIHDKSLYLERMIEDLLELSRLEAGQIRFDFKETPIEAFIANLYKKYELDIQTSGLKAEWNGKEFPYGEGTVMALIDPIRMEQVYGNFIINAIKFTKLGGTIRVGIGWTPKDSAKGLQAVIRVSDNGRGIMQEHLPHIFDRFYKGENELNPFQEGSGLGLSISKEIIEAHKGSIDVKSSFGEGSTFTFTLPVYVLE